MAWFTVYCQWEASGQFYIEADSFAEAEEQAIVKMHTNGIPENGEVISGTLKITDIQKNPE